MTIYRTLLQLVTVFCYMFIIMISLTALYWLLLYLIPLAVIIGITVSYAVILSYFGAIVACFGLLVVYSIVLNNNRTTGL